MAFNSDEYSWSQTDDQVMITFEVDAKFDAKSDANFDIKKNSIHLKVKSKEIQGRLFYEINQNESIWQVEDSTEFTKTITIHLEKTVPFKIWPILVLVDETNLNETDPQSIYNYGSYLHQLNESDSNKAISFIFMAAEKGNASAMLKLAAWYELGKIDGYNFPLDKDQLASHYWHKKVADLYQNPEAAYVVGTTFLHGTHAQEKDLKKASEYFLICFNHKDLHNSLRNVFISSCYYLGLIYMEGGKGLGNPDFTKSLSFFKESAVLGHPESIFNSGIFYMNGFGVEQDIPGGIKMIELARTASPNIPLPALLKEFTSMDLSNLVALSQKIERKQNFTSQLYLNQLVNLVKKTGTEEERQNSVVAEPVVGSNEKVKEEVILANTNGKPKSKKKRKNNLKTNVGFLDNKSNYIVAAGVCAVAALSVGVIVWYKTK